MACTCLYIYLRSNRIDNDLSFARRYFSLALMQCSTVHQLWFRIQYPHSISHSNNFILCNKQISSIRDMLTQRKARGQCTPRQCIISPLSTTIRKSSSSSSWIRTEHQGCKREITRWKPFRRSTISAKPLLVDISRTQWDDNSLVPRYHCLVLYAVTDYYVVHTGGLHSAVW